MPRWVFFPTTSGGLEQPFSFAASFVVNDDAILDPEGTSTTVTAELGTSPNSRHTIIGKLDDSGSFLWTAKSYIASAANGYGSNSYYVCEDGGGNVYAALWTGWETTPRTITVEGSDAATLTNITRTTDQFGFEGWLSKFNSDGVLQWFKPIVLDNSPGVQGRSRSQLKGLAWDSSRERLCVSIHIQNRGSSSYTSNVSEILYEGDAAEETVVRCASRGYTILSFIDADGNVIDDRRYTNQGTSLGTCGVDYAYLHGMAGPSRGNRMAVVGRSREFIRLNLGESDEWSVGSIKNNFYAGSPSMAIVDLTNLRAIRHVHIGENEISSQIFQTGEFYQGHALDDDSVIVYGRYGNRDGSPQTRVADYNDTGVFAAAGGNFQASIGNIVGAYAGSILRVGDDGDVDWYWHAAHVDFPDSTVANVRFASGDIYRAGHMVHPILSVSGITLGVEIHAINRGSANQGYELFPETLVRDWDNENNARAVFGIHSGSGQIRWWKTITSTDAGGVQNIAVRVDELSGYVHVVASAVGDITIDKNGANEVTETRSGKIFAVHFKLRCADGGWDGTYAIVAESNGSLMLPFTHSQRPDTEYAVSRQTTTVVVTYSGADEAVSVPAWAKFCYAKLWGAAGGSDSTYAGGCGGYAETQFRVTPTDDIVVKVGGGGGKATGAALGVPVIAPGGWPDGGDGRYVNNSAISTASTFGGGGRSQLTLNSEIIVIAGGGGAASEVGYGGNGGGWSGMETAGATGGTQTTGGESKDNPGFGAAGANLRGGSVPETGVGNGGGDGWYGGGASYAATGLQGGGGGGSSYVNVLHPAVCGGELLRKEKTPSFTIPFNLTPQRDNDPDYGASDAGVPLSSGTGNNGRVVLIFSNEPLDAFGGYEGKEDVF